MNRNGAKAASRPISTGRMPMPKPWKKVPHQIMMLRLDKAERLGLTYEEYSMEILERGIYLQEEDVERITEIKRARKKRRRKKEIVMIHARL